jgi:hypothetical protein
MNNRYTFFTLLALVFCLLLTPSGISQELLQYPTEESAWGNPYPGLGNVSPGSANPLTSLPQPVLLYATDNADYSDLSPTEKSTDLYLARFPNNKRTGMFQKVNFNTLWAPTDSGLGITELDLSAMFALPMLTRDSPLLITPKYSTTFLDHKNGGSETFHTAGLGLRWIRPIVKDKFTADLGMSMFYSGDYKVRAGDALRFPVHVAGIWQFNPRTKIVLGVVYSDRRDSWNVFPMAGLIWTPHEDLSVELIVPRMRIAQRIRWFGSGAGEEQSDWLYTALEFGSGSWGYEPIDGRVEYRDTRLLLGYERRTRFGLTLGLEVGCMFARRVEFGNYGEHPSESVFLRLRSSF